MGTRARTLSAIVDHARQTQPVRKADLKRGDRLVVSTENSTYVIQVLEDSQYRIRGGWFDRQGLSPVQTRITGCTWGGSVIRTDIVAACGLRLEFANRVVTSCIREVRVIRGDGVGTPRLAAIESAELMRACYGSRLEPAVRG